MQTLENVGDRLQAAKNAAEEDLLLHPAAFGLMADIRTGDLGFENIVGVGIAESEERGSSVAVYVARKVPTDRLEDEVRIPSAYEGVRTTVIESGEFFSASGGERHRPVPLGVSIGHVEGETGTSGFLVKRDGDLFIVSNNHILARENQGRKGDAVIQPGPYDGGVRGDEFAQLSDWIDLDFRGGANWADVAIAATDMSAVSSRAFRGPAIADTLASIAPQRRVWKCGRTTDLTHGRVGDISASVRVRYPRGRALLKDQILVQGERSGRFAAGGDSGSLIIDAAENQPLALLCAVSRKYTVGSKIGRVLEGLGVSWAGDV